MGETVTLRPEVLVFAEAMESTLRANDHKGGWDECDVDYLFRRLTEEVAELKKCVVFCPTVEEYEKAHTPNARGAAMDECVDVANFAMMLFGMYCDSDRTVTA